MLNLAFTEESLSGAAALMEKHIDRWNELLVGDGDSKDWSALMNFTPRVDTLVFEILGDICFGDRSRSKSRIAGSPFLPVIPFLRPRGLSKLLDSARSKEIVMYGEFMETSMKDQLQRQRAHQPSSRQDMIHFLTNTVDPNTGRPAFTDREIQAEASLLVVAGSDSTSVTLCNLFYYLAHYPLAHARLVKEITTMRIAPAGLSELPREVLPGGITSDGEFFPPGTVVGTAFWTDGRNKGVYGDDVEVLRPERWIPSEDNPAEEVSRIKAAFHT
ncbi:cytochrome P450 [Lophiotrema nucula]|uniref:Cytochrome P450 n=1 Tax=Lophiotrema nucula TaxID=690887 RepID=A0A6A5YY09_9PLEO|nr:cytochrome P450 [Lophiotrema nucula]